MEAFDNFWSVYSNLVLSLGINGLLALSIWLTLACGMLALANAAFMGIGAYTASILTLNYGAPFPVAIAAGMAAPALVAFIIGKPTLRLSGVYLAMATLAFGEVVRIAILNAESLTGGALGLNGLPQSTEWWHVALALVLTLVVLWRIRRSKVGRAFEAIKEDETAAGLMGIDVAGHKMLAFVLGGGIGSLTGPVLGGTILTLLPETLRGLGAFRLVVNGFILVLIVLFLPKGIWDPARIRQWFGRKGSAA